MTRKQGWVEGICSGIMRNQNIPSLIKMKGQKLTANKRGSRKKALPPMFASKKGIFFTLISLVLVTIITHIFTQGTAGLGENEATEIRIRVLDSFISKMESSYIPLALESATFRGVNKTVWYMYTQEPDVWLTNPGEELGSIIKNGTLETPAGTMLILDNNTLMNFTRRIKSIAAASYGMEVSVDIHDVRLSQIAPWQLESRVNFSLTAKSSIANWSRQYRIATATLSIEGFPDPQYAVNTEGDYVKVVHRATTQPSQWDAALLGDFIASGNYTRFEGASAPSYLERFKQSPSSSSCCGIESTINDALLPLAMRNQQKSYADYHYFASSSPCPNGGQPADLYNIVDASIIPPFRLDFD